MSESGLVPCRFHIQGIGLGISAHTIINIVWENINKYERKNCRSRCIYKKNREVMLQKLFLCCEVLVLMGLLLEGRVSKGLCLWWEGLVPILPACPRVLEGYRSWRGTGPGGGLRGKISADHLVSVANDALQPLLVLGSGSSVPEGNGRGKDGHVEVHHHCLWQVQLFVQSEGVGMGRWR